MVSTETAEATILVGQRLEGPTTWSSEEAVLILDDIRREVKANPDGARRAALRLLTLLNRPAAMQRPEARGGLAPWQKRKVERYLSEHLTEPLYVGDLADQVSLSVSYFHCAFKATFGTSPHAHITRLRVEHAKAMMLSMEDPLSQIALACGFADQAHLCKIFRAELGETPSSWRKRNEGSSVQTEARRGHTQPYPE